MSSFFRRLRDSTSRHPPQHPRAQAGTSEPNATAAASSQGTPRWHVRSLHIRLVQLDHSILCRVASKSVSRVKSVCTAGNAAEARRPSQEQPSEADMELQRALEASELEEAMAQSRLAAQDQLQHRAANTTPSNLGSAAGDDEQLKLAMELSEAEAKQAAKGKRVMQHTPSEEDLQRALQESTNLATSQQPPYASSAQQSSGEGSSAVPPDPDATDAELARALYESEQLAATTAHLSGHSQAAELPGPASAPMLPPSYTHQSAQATSSSPPPSTPSHSRTAPNQHTQAQPATDSTVRYPAIYQPGSSTSLPPSPFHQQTQQQQSARQELYISQHQSPPQRHHTPQQGMPQPPTQLQAQAPRQYQPAPGHRQLPHPAQHQHHAGSPPGTGPYLDGYHGSANLESILTGDEAFAKSLQEEEYTASMSSAGRQAPPAARSSPRQLPGQGQGHDPSKCPGCGHQLRPPAVVFRGQSWHCSCFRCTACQQPIPPGQKIGIGTEDNMPYHIQCYSQKFDPRCGVCHDLIPKQVIAGILLLLLFLLQLLFAVLAAHVDSMHLGICVVSLYVIM